MLPNTTEDEVHEFRQRIEPVDMIGCTDIAEIHAKVIELAAANVTLALPPLITSGSLVTTLVMSVLAKVNVPALSRMSMPRPPASPTCR